MSRIEEKIMNMNFKKFFIRFILIAAAAVLLGGAALWAGLQDQISETEGYYRELENDDNGEGQESRQNQQGAARTENRGEHRDYGDDNHDWEGFINLSDEGEAAVGAYMGLCLLVFGIYWLSVAAYLYQKAAKCRMNELFWLFVGLGFNLAGVAAFFITRRFTRQRCRECGLWQIRERRFCADCGAEMNIGCPECGNLCSHEDKYCSSCGNSLTSEDALTEVETDKD